MRCLSVDDKPEDYIVGLHGSLARYNVECTVTTTPEEFLERWHNENWDFLTVDLIWENTPNLSDETNYGTELLERIRARPKGLAIPIFIVTGYLPKLQEIQGLPANVRVKSKTTGWSFLAFDLVTELRRMNRWQDRSSVFLIYGRDCETPAGTEKLRLWFRDRGLTDRCVTPGTAVQDVAREVISAIKECGAVVALCTPDDEWADGSRHPRQNVLLEIGVALGHLGGPDRLAIVQRWGPQMETRALLPSDLGGLITARFESKVEEAFASLEERFRIGGLRLNA
jgi:CheY-like chemotaxis protein